MKTLGSEWDLQGGQLTNATVENIATFADWDFPIGGALKFMSPNGDKRLCFWDNQLSSAIYVPRLDRAESWTAAPAFTVNFTVGSAALITNLNADLLDSMNSATAATASTIAARDASGRLTGEDPSSPTDLVNLRFMQSNLRNAVDKGAVRVSTTVSLPAYTFSANEYVASANGALPALDGVTVAVGDLVALLYEGGVGNPYYLGTASNLNGLARITDMGSGGTPWKMVRAVNADVSSEVTPGMFFAVSEGTNQSNSVWTLFTDGPIYLRTEAPKNVAAVTAAGGTLTASTAYYYRVTMVDYSGSEAAVTIFEVTATTDVTNKTINLSWDAYAEAASYRVYRSLTSGTYGATSLVGTTTSAVFSDTGIALTTGTPKTASNLQFAKTGSNAFYSGGNGIDVSGTVISAKISGSTTYVTNRILFNGSISSIDGDANLTWNLATLSVVGGLTVTGTTTLATALSGISILTAGVVSSTTGTQYGLPYFATTTTLASTAAGGANTVLIANGGAPSFSAAITVGTSVTSPSIVGTTSVTTPTITSATGDLNVLTGGSNGHIVLDPDGSGTIKLKAVTTLNNNVAFQILDVGGTARRIILNSGDVYYVNPDAEYPISIGGSGVAGIGNGGIAVAGNSKFNGTLLVGGVLTLASLSGILIGTAGAVSATTDIATGITIGGAYIYRVGGTDVIVADGGTGVSTFTLNGVLYGNAANPLLVTAQGAANTVLVANAGAPSFSAAITVGTSVTTPLVIASTSVSTPSIITASGALGITPAAGSGVNLTLSTTGDFAVNTNQFYVDTSTGGVGVGTVGTSPGSARLMVVDTNKATDSGGIVLVASSDAQAINKGGQITFGGGYTDAGGIQYFASIAGRKSDSVSGDLNGYLSLATAFGGTQIERVRITSAGYVGIWNPAPSTLLHVGLAGTTLGTIGIAGNTSGLVTLTVAAAAGTWTLQLPADGGTANYFLKTNGSGVSSWSNSLPAVTTIAGVSIPRIYVALIGTGTDPFLDHNLGTRNIAVVVRRVASPYDQVIIDNEATTTNRVTFHSRLSLDADAFTAIVMAI